MAALPVSLAAERAGLRAAVALRSAVASDLRSVFNAPDRGAAEEQLEKLVEKYRRTAPKLAEWMEATVPEGLAVFALPESHRRRNTAHLHVFTTFARCDRTS